MKNSIAIPSKFAIVLLWTPMLVFGVVIVLLSSLGGQPIEWLFDNYPLVEANRIVLVFFGAFSGWLILNSIWFGILGLKTYIRNSYPPGNLPTPLKSKQLVGSNAKKASSVLFAIAILSFLFGVMFAYAQYISNSSGL